MDLIKECEGAKKIGISGHVRPDGDCVGGCLALSLYLRSSLPGAEVTVFLEKPSEIFREIAGFEQIVILEPDAPCKETMDVFFVLDCMPDRIGSAQRYYETAAKKINIDHHISNPGCGDVHLVRPQVGAVCEVLYDLMEPGRLNEDIALALYIGIIHDTGVFQYSNTTSDTLKRAAHLIGFGFDFPRLIQETFYQKTWLQTRLCGQVLAGSRLFLDGQCAVGMMSRETMEELGAVPADLEGIVNQLRNVKGVHCAVFLYETGEQECKISLRSDEKVDAARVAARLGGGGHVRAAGCTVKGSAQDCLEQVVRLVAEQLKAMEKIND